MAIPPFVPGRVSFNGSHASPEVTRAIHQASQRTGVDFNYLVAQAGQESSFKTDAKASTSSARGLYQFIDSTWLSMIRDKGAAYGLGDLAASIEGAPDMPRVADPDQRRKILALRDDPTLSASMAAEFAKNNRGALEGALGRRVNATELYMAHFLGASGATRFLSAVEKAPDQIGAAVLPDAAASNRGAFYDRATGKALSVRQIYDSYARKFEGEMSPKISPKPATPDTPPQPPSLASIVRRTLVSALTGDQLSPVTIQALMQMGVPGSLERQDKAAAASGQLSAAAKTPTLAKI